MYESKVDVRFLQVSDIHLGSRIGLGWLTPEQCEEMNRCVRDSFRRAMLLAREKQVDAVLIPGDLFDDESVKPEQVSWAVSCFKEIAPIPVFIAPGNHDPYWPGSPYHPMWTARNPQLAWPENVFIFTHPQFETVQLQGSNYSVTGIAHTNAGEIRERLLAGNIACGNAPVRVLLLHGSREAVGLPPKEKTLPFTDDELANQSVHWAAIGHYHSASIIQDSQTRQIGGYSGCPQGRGLDECGTKGALLVDITERGAKTEFVELASRGIWQMAVDVTGKGLPEIIGAIESAVAPVSAGDLVTIKLSGRLNNDTTLDFPPGFISDQVFACQCDFAAVTPDYDLEQLLTPQDCEGLPGRFAQRITELRAAAPEEEQGLFDEALYLGLDAIYGKSLRSPDAY